MKNTDRLVEVHLAHLQKVYFTLVACLGVVVASNIGGRNGAAVALEDLNRIVDVVGKWEPDWLQSAAREIVRERVVDDLVSTTTPGWTPMSTEGTKRYPIGGAPT